MYEEAPSRLLPGARVGLLLCVPVTKAAQGEPRSGRVRDPAGDDGCDSDAARRGSGTEVQGLTLVHFSAQPKPFWSLKPLHASIPHLNLRSFYQ